MAPTWNASDRVELGSSGLRCSRIGLGSSYGLGERGVERAFDAGINYFYWGSYRRGGFGRGVRNLAQHARDELVIVVQSYTRAAWMMAPSLDRALKKLRIDRVDLLLLGMWNSPPPARIVDAARALVDRGKARAIQISCHARPTFERYLADPAYDSIMVRYNAAHPGAEEEVFPHVGPRADGGRAGVVSYTTTSWGRLLNKRRQPLDEPAPRGSDCYRFALTRPEVDLCLAGPANAGQLDEALATFERGPMDEGELAWMKRVGAVTR
jgi:aryl-alcohol dehydrogenase-like predicted oxidoreductase